MIAYAGAGPVTSPRSSKGVGSAAATAMQSCHTRLECQCLEAVSCSPPQAVYMTAPLDMRSICSYRSSLPWLCGLAVWLL